MDTLYIWAGFLAGSTLTLLPSALPALCTQGRQKTVALPARPVYPAGSTRPVETTGPKCKKADLKLKN
jgi:hypothetical protein